MQIQARYERRPQAVLVLPGLLLTASSSDIEGQCQLQRQQQHSAVQPWSAHDQGSGDIDSSDKSSGSSGTSTATLLDSHTTRVSQEYMGHRE